MNCKVALQHTKNLTRKVQGSSCSHTQHSVPAGTWAVTLVAKQQDLVLVLLFILLLIEVNLLKYSNLDQLLPVDLLAKNGPSLLHSSSWSKHFLVFVNMWKKTQTRKHARWLHQTHYWFRHLRVIINDKFILALSSSVSIVMLAVLLLNSQARKIGLGGSTPLPG